MRPAISREDLLMEATAGYAFFAERYGWTTQQVDAQPLWYIRRLSTVASVVDEIRAERAKSS